MNSEQRRKKRRRAERRFRFYGQLGLGAATLALAVLLSVIITKGAAGLVRTQIEVPVVLERTDLAHPNETPWRSRVQQGVTQLFPDYKEASGRHRLLRLLSDNADMEVRRYAERHAGTQGTVKLWLTAADTPARYIRADRKSRDADPSLRLDDEQKQWLKTLEERGAVRSVFDVAFFTHGDSRSPEQAGCLSSIIGSLLTLLVCLGVAFPLGVLTAVYLEEFAARNRFTDFIEVNINNLAAVPSIVFGLLGLAIYLNLFGMPRSAPLVGGLTLALLILPTIIIATRASLKAVPDSIRNAARALGASPVQMVFHHVVPLALPGIMTGTILGLARAIGETAPLLLIGMVAFVADIPKHFADPAAVMPVQIYLWASSPELSFVEKTAAGIMVLLAILLLMNAVAIVIRKKFEHHW